MEVQSLEERSPSNNRGWRGTPCSTTTTSLTRQHKSIIFKVAIVWAWKYSRKFFMAWESMTTSSNWSTTLLAWLVSRQSKSAQPTWGSLHMDPIPTHKMTFHLCMIESTAIECMYKFCRGVVEKLGKDYLRGSNQAKTAKIMSQNKVRGFHGMLGSIDWLHWILQCAARSCGRSWLVDLSFFF
jgi:hypothetical protein